MKKSRADRATNDMSETDQQSRTFAPNRVRLPNEREKTSATPASPPEKRARANRPAIVIPIVLLVIGIGFALHLPQVISKHMTRKESFSPASTSDGEALFVQAGQLISTNIANVNGNVAGWIVTPDYQTLSMLGMTGMAPEAGDRSPRLGSASQVRARQVEEISAVMNSNKTAMSDISMGLGKDCIMEGNDSEFVTNRCSALLLLRAYLHLLQHDYNGAISDAFITLKLDSLLSRNAAIRNFAQILRLNGAARSLIIYVLQLQYPHFPSVTGALPGVSRAVIAKIQKEFNAYVAQRVSLGEVLTAYSDRYAVKLMKMLPSAGALRPVATALFDNTVHPPINSSSNMTSSNRVITPKSLLNEYEYEMTRYIASVKGQYQQGEVYPLQSWQNLLIQAAPSVGVRLRPMPPLTLDEHADLAWDRMVQVTLAELLYEYDHGTLPASLNKLVPRYLPVVPVDPFARKPEALRYLVAEPKNMPFGSFNCGGLVYSVGPDGSDNEGQPYETFEPAGSFGGRQPQSLNPMTKGDLVVNNEDETAWELSYR